MATSIGAGARRGSPPTYGQTWSSEEGRPEPGRTRETGNLILSLSARATILGYTIGRRKRKYPAPEAGIRRGRATAHQAVLRIRTQVHAARMRPTWRYDVA